MGPFVSVLDYLKSLAILPCRDVIIPVWFVKPAWCDRHGRQQDALADMAHTPRGILVLGLDGALSGNALVVQDLCSCSVVRLCLIYRQPHQRQDADDAEGDRYEQVDVRGSHDVAPT